MTRAYSGWVHTVCQVHWALWRLWLYSVPACLLHLQVAHVPPVSTSSICSLCTDSDTAKNFAFWKDLILSHKRGAGTKKSQDRSSIITFFSVIVSSQSKVYLHDYEFKHEGHLTDVSWRQVKQERSIPHGTGSSLSFSAADHSSFMMQINHHLVFWKQTHKDYEVWNKIYQRIKIKHEN